MKQGKSNKTIYLIASLIIGTVLFFILDLFLGSVHIPIKNIIAILFGEIPEKESWSVIILESRLPKAIAAILCGAALSVSGLQMQTLFRNPLAGPYILGISSGAGLGVAIFIMGLSFLGVSVTGIGLPANSGMIISSILGSFGVLAILLSIINRLKDIMTVLILGIMIGSVITAIIGIIQYFSHDSQLKSFIMWTMGDLSSITNSQLTLLAPIVLIGLALAFISSKSLNAYLLGEEYATSLGVNIKKSRIIIIVITSVLTGSITAYCGPIGFIGIVIPHLARMISNSSDHKILIPLSILLGINVLLISDIISQLPGLEQSLPINSITSLIGIPFIIWIILKNKKITNLN
ncbi:MAG: iron ABC transporter permease [Flavobacteriales bacterium]|nr:iron ABC transporter permease [Flavobacteriales bacterium]